MPKKIHVVKLTPEERAELEAVARSRVRDGIVALHAHGATAALMIQENADIGVDVVEFLAALIPPGRRRHDRIDDNGDAHLKAGLVGPSETVPLIDGQLGISRWQDIFLCEFDGPRRERTVVCTVIGNRG